MPSAPDWPLINIAPPLAPVVHPGPGRFFDQFRIYAPIQRTLKIKQKM
jgi:hypothetical protein